MPVTATFGTVEYREGGVIAIPLNFAVDVIVPSKSICRITRVSGSDLTGVNYRIIGKGRAFETIIEVPPDRKGSFSVAMTGTVLNTLREWDTVTVAASTVTYDTRVPRIVNYDIPAEYQIGEPFSVRVALNVPVTGWHANNTFTEGGIFLPEGAYLGAELPYKWTGTSPPDFTVPVPDDLTNTDWQLLATPPGGHQGEWHGAEGQYFMIRFSEVDENATGIFQMTLREENPLRGPVS